MSVSFWQLLRPSRHNSTAAETNPHPLGIAPTASRLLGRIQLLYDHIASPRFLMFQSVPCWRRFPAYTIDQGGTTVDADIAVLCRHSFRARIYQLLTPKGEGDDFYVSIFHHPHTFCCCGKGIERHNVYAVLKKSWEGSGAEWGAGGVRRCELWGRVDGEAGVHLLRKSVLFQVWDDVFGFYFNCLRVLFQPLFRLLFSAADTSSGLLSRQWR